MKLIAKPTSRITSGFIFRQNSQENTCVRATFYRPEPGQLLLLLVNFNSKIDTKIYW